MTNKTKNGMRLVLVVMSILLLASIVLNFYFFFGGFESARNLEEQVESLTEDLNLLNTTYNEYRRTYTYTTSEYQSLDLSARMYLSAHTVLDEDYEDLQNQYASLSAIYEDYALSHIYSNSEYDAVQDEVEALESEIETANQQVSTLQGEIEDLEDQIDVKDGQIAMLQAEIDDTRISLEIENVTWDAAADTATITVRNTGGVNVTITSLNLQETTPEAPWITDTSTDATGWVTSGEAKDFVWDGAEVGYDLLGSTSYLIQVNYVSTYTSEYSGETPTS